MNLMRFGKPQALPFVSLELFGLLSLLHLACLPHCPCWGWFPLLVSQFLLPHVAWLWVTVVLILVKLYFCVLEPDWSVIQILEYLTGSAWVRCSLLFSKLWCIHRSGHLGSPLQKEEGDTTKAWAGQQSPKQVYCRSLLSLINTQKQFARSLKTS